MNSFGDKLKYYFKYRTWQFWVIIGVAVAILASIIISIIYFAEINKKLDTPKNLSIYELSTGEIFVEVNKIDKAHNYEFYFVFNNKKTIFNDKNNIIEVSSYMKKGGIYDVKCRAFGATDASASNYTKSVSYTHYVHLNAPTISFNNDKTKIVVTLQDDRIDDVDLVFSLIYKMNDEGVPLVNEDFVIDTTSKGSAKARFNLNFLSKGEYSLSVRVSAKSNPYYEESDISNQLRYNVS